MRFKLILRMTLSISLGLMLWQGLSVANANDLCDPAQNKLLPNGHPAWTKGVKQLTWYNAGSTQYDPAIMEGVTAFEARYGIHVKVVGIPEKSFFTKATRLLATGDTTYDNFDIYPAFPMPSWAARGWVAPVDCVVPKYLIKQWPKEYWKAAEYKGKHYFVPHIVEPYVLLWNKKLFKKAGLDPNDPPQTIDELVSDAKKLTKDTDGDGNIDQWGFVFPAGKIERVPILTFAEFLGMQGHRLWNEDGSVGFDNEAGVKALQIMADLVRKYKVSPAAVINYNTSSVADIFSSGGAAMAMNFLGHPVTKEVEALGRENIGAIPPPGAAGVKVLYPVGFVATAQFVNAKSDNVLAALHLAVFMGSYAQSWREALLEDNIGVNLNIWHSPVLTSPKFADYHHQYPFPTTAKKILVDSYLPTHNNILPALDVFKVGISSAITGRKTPKEAIDYMVNKLKNRGVTQ